MVDRAGGEERLAARLDASAGQALRLLHDRRIPRSRANIDHIAVTSTGVYVIDAKRYQGRPDVRAEGGLFRPRVERLVVGRRDCTPLLDSLDKQVAAVRAALAQAHNDVSSHGVLCFVDADWPLLGGDLTVRSVRVLSPKKLRRRLATPGDVNSGVIEAVHGALAEALPPACRSHRTACCSADRLRSTWLRGGRSRSGVAGCGPQPVLGGAVTAQPDGVERVHRRARDDAERCEGCVDRQRCRRSCVSC